MRIELSWTERRDPARYRALISLLFEDAPRELSKRTDGIREDARPARLDPSSAIDRAADVSASTSKQEPPYAQ